MANFINEIVLMCHAPIVIPEVAGPRAKDCLSTTEAMEKAGKFLASKNPDCVIVLSPHTPRLRDAYSLVGDAVISGNLGQFGVKGVNVSFTNAKEEVSSLLGALAKYRIAIKEISLQRSVSGMDHGALVPLYFLSKAGYAGKIILIGFPHCPGFDECKAIGGVINELAGRLRKKWAILASGDMSHKLLPESNLGFHPRAKSFDEFFTNKIKEGDILGAVSGDESLRDLAAEDVVDSVAIAGAACNFEAKNHKILSYEGPFGVGYLVAILRSEGGVNNV